MHQQRNLPPEKLLTLVIDMEEKNIQCWQLWALRFRPFNPGLALILDMQVREMQCHKSALLDHACRLFPDQEEIQNPTMPEGPVEHFFILNVQSAITVLKQALKLNQDTRRLYGYCLMGAPRGSLLEGLYTNLGAFKDIHIQILQEALDSLRWSAPKKPDPVPDQSFPARSNAGQTKPLRAKRDTTDHVKYQASDAVLPAAGNGRAQAGAGSVSEFLEDQQGAWRYEIEREAKQGRVQLTEPGSYRNDPADPRAQTAMSYRKLSGETGHYLAAYSDLGGMRDSAAAGDEYEHDTQTGPRFRLPDRLQFESFLDLGLARAKRCGKKLGILMMELDHFHYLNNSLGKTVSDQLLKAVVQRLQESVRTQDIVARLKENTFTVLLEDIADEPQAMATAQNILTAVGKPLRLGEYEVFTTLSMGISLFPEDGVDRVALLESAEKAMHRHHITGLQ